MFFWLSLPVILILSLIYVSFWVVLTFIPRGKWHYFLSHQFEFIKWLVKFKPQRSVIWCHSPSGEVQYIKGLIREALSHQFQVILTYTSPSILPLIQDFERTPLIFKVLPLDGSLWMWFFFLKIKPRAIVLAKTDFWPLMLGLAHFRHVPIIVVAPNFLKTSNFLSHLWKTFWLRFSRIVIVHDQASFQKGLEAHIPVRLCPDSRWDLAREYGVLRKSTNCRFILVLASVWPQDLDFWLQEWHLRPSDWIHQFQLVLVPHEPGRFSWDQVKQMLAKLDWDFFWVTDWDQQASEALNHSVVWVNQVGCLIKIYAQSHGAFVGGSFQGRVHNVLEPMVFGLPVAVGPHHLNSLEAVLAKNWEWSSGLSWITPLERPSDGWLWAQRCQKAYEHVNLSQQAEKLAKSLGWGSDVTSSKCLWKVVSEVLDDHVQGQFPNASVF